VNSGIGRLITLEGIDGSGKSTALQHIASRLRALRPERRLLLSAEPTEGPVGRIIRGSLRTAGGAGCSGGAPAAERMNELFLFLADHAQHLAGTVIPALEEGALVLCDRYADSTAAYQGVTLRSILPEPVAWIQGILLPWSRPPDLTILFVIDPQAALLRIEGRRGREKFERLEFLQSVDENFRSMADFEPDRFVLVDAALPAEQVADDATSAILRRLDL